METLYKNYEWVKDLRNALSNGKNIANIFIICCRQENWKQYINTAGGKCIHPDFISFVTSRGGLNTTLENLRSAISYDSEALDLFDELTKRSPGGDKKSSEYKINVDNVNNDRPTGNTKQYGLRRLREHNPDLHNKVLSGELSVNQAMIEAGYRKKTVTIPTDDAEKIFNILKKNLDKNLFYELKKHFTT